MVYTLVVLDNITKFILWDWMTLLSLFKVQNAITGFTPWYWMVYTLVYWMTLPSSYCAWLWMTVITLYSILPELIGFSCSGRILEFQHFYNRIAAKFKLYHLFYIQINRSGFAGIAGRVPLQADNIQPCTDVEGSTYINLILIFLNGFWNMCALHL